MAAAAQAATPRAICRLFATACSARGASSPRALLLSRPALAPPPPPAHAGAADHHQPRRRQRVRRDVRAGVRRRRQEHHQLLHVQGHAHGHAAAVRDEPAVIHLVLQLCRHQRPIGRRLLPSLARKGEAGPGREGDDHAPPPVRQMDQEMRPRQDIRADLQREPGHHAPEAAGDRDLADRRHHHRRGQGLTAT